MKDIESKTLALKHEIASLMNRIATISLEIDVLNHRGTFEKLEQKLRERNVLRYKLQAREAALSTSRKEDVLDYNIVIMR